MRTIRSTLWLRKASVSAQMTNETNLCAEESWAVRTRNSGGSGWCCSAFSKFTSQLGWCVSSGFTEFHSMFDNFTLLVSVLWQIFQAIRGDTKDFMETIIEALLLASLGTLILRQFLQGAVIFHSDNMTGPKKQLLYQDDIDAGKKSLS